MRLLPIERDIYRVFSFFSFFDYPLTAFEVWKYLYQPKKAYTFFDIQNTLQFSSFLTKYVQSSNGFYGIQGRTLKTIHEQLDERHKRYLNAIEKYKKLKKYLWYLKCLPSVQGIAICNSLAMHFTKAESDIDLFIITKPNKLWNARFFCVAPLKFLKQRPGEAKKDPIDISFYLSNDQLSLFDIRSGKNDPYLAYWIRQLVPVSERKKGLFNQFWKENDWALDLLPNTDKSTQDHVLFSSKKWFPLPLVLPESFAKNLQEKIMPISIQSKRGEGSNVILSDQMLKFHQNDRREEVTRWIEEQMRFL